MTKHDMRMMALPILVIGGLLLGVGLREELPCNYGKFLMLCGAIASSLGHFLNGRSFSLPPTAPQKPEPAPSSFENTEPRQ